MRITYHELRENINNDIFSNQYLNFSTRHNFYNFNLTMNFEIKSFLFILYNLTNYIILLKTKKKVSFIF